MYRIIDKRGTGKTSRLMLLAKEENAIIACSNPNAMKIKAEGYGIIGLNFISYYDYVMEIIQKVVRYLLMNLIASSNLLDIISAAIL